eukprot:scaffold8700_cov31-Tisochrysis_lutea.AAC.5
MLHFNARTGPEILASSREFSASAGPLRAYSRNGRRAGRRTTFAGGAVSEWDCDSWGVRARESLCKPTRSEGWRSTDRDDATGDG